VERVPVRLGIQFENRPGVKPASFFSNVDCILNSFNFIESEEVDYILYYNHAQIPPNKNKVNIFYSQEAVLPDMKRCSWALGYPYEETVCNPHYLRFPNYILYGGYEKLIKSENYNAEKIASQKTKFCAYVFWHRVPIRIEMFKTLSRYKRVDAPGRCCNNCSPINASSISKSRYALDYPKRLIEFLKPYKFAIVFENEEFVGRTDEKIFLAMQANCIPIFWGNPQVNKDFNTKSFVNAHESNSVKLQGMLQDVADRVAYLDKNDAAYLAVLKEPWYNNNKINPYVDPNRIVEFFTRIFST